MAKRTMAEISAAATERGWRYVLGTVAASVPVGSLVEAAELAARVAAAAGPDPGGALRLDARADRLLVTLDQDRLDLLGPVADALGSGAGATPPVQGFEIGIDALDIPGVLPFWRAVLDYVDESAYAIVDPRGQGPAIWFQQMDEPRPQRNRVHIDITVPHDEAGSRRELALAAGGRLLSDAAAPAFWVLADPEGNEVCICTWQGRD
jgi:4a-hydroxytetrahydrobiopterin dehydratase